VRLLDAPGVSRYPPMLLFYGRFGPAASQPSESYAEEKVYRT